MPAPWKSTVAALAACGKVALEQSRNCTPRLPASISKACSSCPTLWKASNRISPTQNICASWAIEGSRHVRVKRWDTQLSQLWAKHSASLEFLAKARSGAEGAEAVFPQTWPWKFSRKTSLQNSSTFSFATFSMEFKLCFVASVSPFAWYAANMWEEWLAWHTQNVISLELCKTLLECLKQTCYRVQHDSPTSALALHFVKGVCIAEKALHSSRLCQIPSQLRGQELRKRNSKKRRGSKSKYPKSSKIKFTEVPWSRHFLQIQQIVLQ